MGIQSVIKHAAALVKTAAVEYKLIGNGWRFSVVDRGSSFRLEELPTKGKRSLLRGEFTNQGNIGPSARQSDAFLWQNIIREARLDPSDTIGEVMEKIELAYAYALVELGNTIGKDAPSYLQSKWYVKDVSSLKVTPEGAEKIEAKGADFVLTAEWTKFSAYSPNSDFNQHDPHYSEIVATSPGAARKLYKMVQANPNLLNSVSWSDFSDFLKKNGIGFKYNFSQWT